jgi:hypothetical protein
MKFILISIIKTLIKKFSHQGLIPPDPTAIKPRPTNVNVLLLCYFEQQENID